MSHIVLFILLLFLIKKYLDEWIKIGLISLSLDDIASRIESPAPFCYPDE